jgi:hypothetical protein
MGLTRSSGPFGPIRHLALLTGLGSAEASVRIAAADVWKGVFASANRLVSAKSPNLHLLLQLTREIGTAIALPEPPERIVALAAGKGLDQAHSRRHLVKP